MHGQQNIKIYVSIRRLINDTVSSSDYITFSGRTVNNELQGMWNETVVG